MSPGIQKKSARKKRGGFFRKVLAFLSAVIITALLLFGALAAVMIHFNAPPETPPAAVLDTSPDGGGLRFEDSGALLLEVKSGESADSVGRRLEDAGVIRSRYFWQLLSRFRKDYIKSGTYRVELPASQMSIHSVLLGGEQILVKVTVPEGVTLKKTAALMEDAGICAASQFMAAASSGPLRERYRVSGPTMEGYLYPDTYLFPLSFPAEKVVAAMADTFFRRLGEFAPEALSADSEELNRRVIIASIVEREYRVDEEADLMAGVFFNRLEIGMALQSCATVEYIITEIQGRPHPDLLLNRDLEIRDPYNTYMRPGLPPGPISAPGRVALNAAFNPRASDFLYFRLVDSAAGRHYFSRTLDEHIRAGRLYTKGP